MIVSKPINYSLRHHSPHLTRSRANASSTPGPLARHHHLWLLAFSRKRELPHYTTTATPLAQTRGAASPTTTTTTTLPSLVRARGAASPTTTATLSLLSCKREEPRHHPLTTILSHPNAKGRVTTHSPPPPCVQTRGAASPPTHHHHPLPSKREGPRHRPLTTTTFLRANARSRVTYHNHRHSPSHANASSRVTYHHHHHHSRVTAQPGHHHYHHLTQPGPRHTRPSPLATTPNAAFHLPDSSRERGVFILDHQGLGPPIRPSLDSSAEGPGHLIATSPILPPLDKSAKCSPGPGCHHQLHPRPFG
jgi:hypothetical protein